jgi:hypothetical protein
MLLKHILTRYRSLFHTGMDRRCSELNAERDELFRLRYAAFTWRAGGLEVQANIPMDRGNTISCRVNLDLENVLKRNYVETQ